MRYRFLFLHLLGLVCANDSLRKTLYDEEYAKQLLDLSAGAYFSDPNLCVRKTLPKSEQWSLLTSIEHNCDSVGTSCRYYIIASDKTRTITVVFRGTQTPAQLFVEGWQSLNPKVNFYGAGKVNRYFFYAFATLWHGIEAVLTDAKYKSYNVTFTGHSLGGALASLAAVKAVLAGHRAGNQVKLYTFGQPRVGCTRFAKVHDHLVPHSFRVVHRLDIVPHLPPCQKASNDSRVEPSDDSLPCDTSGENSYHHGTEIWYPTGMSAGAQYNECLGTPMNEDFDCSDRISFRLSEYDTYIADHRLYFDRELTCGSSSEIDEAPPLRSSRQLEASNEASNNSRTQEGKFESVARKLRIALRFLELD